MPLYAFDGTWNKQKDGEDANRNTNVMRFHAAYQKNAQAPQFYVSGVGTRHKAVGAVLGGVFGLGELARIKEGYRQLCNDWIAANLLGKKLDIDVIGFSRGAATALDFAHYLLAHGIREPDTEAQLAPAPEIRFLGLWDVVAAFGLANLGNQVLNFGHHLELPRQNLKYCFHALALDERRLSFLPTRLPGACEVWFRGVHSDVGGGNANRGLNDISLRWMMNKAQAAGLPILDDDIQALNPVVCEPQPDHKLPATVRVVAGVDRRHYTVAPMPGWTTPPVTCPVETTADEKTATPVGANGIEVLPREVRDRMSAMLESAADRVRRRGSSLDGDETTEWLLTLVEGRVGLVQSEADLQRARAAMETLVDRAADEAGRKGFSNTLPAFFLNQALFGLPHLFPLTD